MNKYILLIIFFSGILFFGCKKSCPKCPAANQCEQCQNCEECEECPECEKCKECEECEDCEDCPDCPGCPHVDPEDPDPYEGKTATEIGNWTGSQASFESSMTFICIPVCKGVEIPIDATDRLAAFINGECRNVADAVSFTQNGKTVYRFLLEVKGDMKDQSMVVIKFYKTSRKFLYEGDSFDFQANQHSGSVQDPYEFELK